VRELDNAIQRALILQQGGLIQPQDFCLAARSPARPCRPWPVPVRAVEVEAETGGALGDDLRRREFQMIIDTLRAERGRRKEAAERLGISPRTCATSWRRCAMRDGRGSLSVRHLTRSNGRKVCRGFLRRLLQSLLLAPLLLTPPSECQKIAGAGEERSHEPRY
jgi:hypothetical protein